MIEPVFNKKQCISIKQIVLVRHFPFLLALEFETEGNTTAFGDITWCVALSMFPYNLGTQHTDR
jgi:hypothetical protein